LLGSPGDWVSATTCDEWNYVSGIDKAKDKIPAAKGKEAAGKADDQQSHEAEGRRDQAAGDLKLAGEKVKDAFNKPPGAVT
jgi:uncharacterized protein YjbJ (UPF0337 family)